MAKKSTRSVPKQEPKYADAAGAVVASQNAERGKRIEDAMSAAVTKAAEDGVTDATEIRERMLAAADEARNAE